MHAYNNYEVLYNIIWPLWCSHYNVQYKLPLTYMYVIEYVLCADKVAWRSLRKGHQKIVSIRTSTFFSSLHVILRIQVWTPEVPQRQNGGWALGIWWNRASNRELLLVEVHVQLRHGSHLLKITSVMVGIMTTWLLIITCKIGGKVSWFDCFLTFLVKFCGLLHVRVRT